MTCYLCSKEETSIATDPSPNGSYTTTLGWLKAHRQDKINIPDPSDVISFFDNNQVLIIYYYHFIIIFYLLIVEFFSDTPLFPVITKKNRAG